VDDHAHVAPVDDVGAKDAAKADDVADCDEHGGSGASSVHDVIFGQTGLVKAVNKATGMALFRLSFQQVENRRCVLSKKDGPDPGP